MKIKMERYLQCEEYKKYNNKEFEILKTKIEYGKKYFLIEVEGKEEWVTHFVFKEIIDLNPEDCRKVVIFKNVRRNLPPYWFQKLMNKRNIKVYTYIAIDKNSDESDFVYTEDLSNYKDFDEPYYDVIFYTKYISDSITSIDVEKLTKSKDRNIDIYDIYENREDEAIIKIAEEINDENRVKIVSIPNDVEYFIELGQGNGEYIQEESRSWN